MGFGKAIVQIFEELQGLQFGTKANLWQDAEMQLKYWKILIA